MQTIVLATGVFDILHPGHIHYLRESRKLGDKLCVIVANDKTVLKNKGKMPVFTQEERKFILENLRIVDRVVIGRETNFLETAIELSPNIITLGWDQKIKEDALSEQFNQLNYSVHIHRIARFKEYSSGTIKAAIHI